MGDSDSDTPVPLPEFEAKGKRHREPSPTGQVEDDIPEFSALSAAERATTWGKRTCQGFSRVLKVTNQIREASHATDAERRQAADLMDKALTLLRDFKSRWVQAESMRTARIATLTALPPDASKEDQDAHTAELAKAEADLRSVEALLEKRIEDQVSAVVELASITAPRSVHSFRPRGNEEAAKLTTTEFRESAARAFSLRPDRAGYEKIVFHHENTLKLIKGTWVLPKLRPGAAALKAFRKAPDPWFFTLAIIECRGGLFPAQFHNVIQQYALSAYAFSSTATTNRPWEYRDVEDVLHQDPLDEEAHRLIRMMDADVEVKRMRHPAAEHGTPQSTPSKRSAQHTPASPQVFQPQPQPQPQPQYQAPRQYQAPPNQAPAQPLPRRGDAPAPRDNQSRTAANGVVVPTSAPSPAQQAKWDTIAVLEALKSDPAFNPQHTYADGLPFRPLPQPQPAPTPATQCTFCKHYGHAQYDPANTQVLACLRLMRKYRSENKLIPAAVPGWAVQHIPA